MIVTLHLASLLAQATMADTSRFFDLQIHLGDIIVSTVGLIMSWIAGRGLKFLNEHMKRVAHTERRVTNAETVVDAHSTIIEKHGWASKTRLPRITQKRRQDDDDLIYVDPNIL